MRSSGFSFKREGVWMLVFSLTPSFVGLLIILMILGVRLLH
jgi:hypothetical protein